MSRYLIFAAISLSLLLAGINSTAIAVAFPTIISSFKVSLILAGWVMSIYQLVATAAMPLAGKISDVFGRKFTFMASLSLFTLGSLLCAIAPNIQLLILFRLIQGVGGGAFLPVATGIVADEFPRSRQQAIGLFTSILPIGQIIGPNLGGWMINAFGWRSVFWFNIPLGLAALIASAFLLRTGQREQGHMDLMGAGLFTGSLAAFMVGLSEMGNSYDGIPWTICGLLFVAGIVFMVVFIRHINKVKNPIIDLQVLKEKPFIAANIYNFIYGACAFGVLSFVPLYAVSLYGMSTLQSGLILTPRSIGMMAASTLTSVLLMRWGYRWPMVAGNATMVLSLFLLGIEPSVLNILGIHMGSIVLLIIIMLLSGIGAGIAAPAANNACIDLMPHRVSSITGIRGMFRQSGGAVSIAIVSLLLHNIPDMAHGFAVVFFGLAIVMLVTTPLVFAMPDAPKSPFLASQDTANKGS
jgi:EmrB/QacA subfamily drug resistance transporter